MLNNKSNKEKLLFGSVGAFILILVIYQFTFKKTFEEIGKCNQLEERIVNGNNASDKIPEIEAKLRKLGSVPEDNADFEGSFHELLLNIVSEYCSQKKLQLVEFPEQHYYEENGIEVNTYKFVVEGRYTKLLKLLYMIETSGLQGNVASVDFTTEKNRKTKQLELYMTVYIQKINSK